MPYFSYSVSRRGANSRVGTLQIVENPGLFGRASTVPDQESLLHLFLHEPSNWAGINVDAAIDCFSARWTNRSANELQKMVTSPSREARLHLRSPDPYAHLISRSAASNSGRMMNWKCPVLSSA